MLKIPNKEPIRFIFCSINHEKRPLTPFSDWLRKYKVIYYNSLLIRKAYNEQFEKMVSSILYLILQHMLSWVYLVVVGFILKKNAPFILW